MDQPKTGSQAETPEPEEVEEEALPDPLQITRGQAAEIIAENSLLRDKLQELAVERAELTNRAEGAGEALQEAARLRKAFDIDPGIAIFAEIMDEVSKEPIEIEVDYGVHEFVKSAAAQFLGMTQGEAPEIYRAAAKLALRAMRLADTRADRIKIQRQKRRTALAKRVKRGGKATAR